MVTNINSFIIFLIYSGGDKKGYNILELGPNLLAEAMRTFMNAIP